jgi:hypothetical protein
MHILLSFCNEQRSPDRGLVLYSLGTRKGTWIGVGTRAEIMGTRGMCVHDEVLYAFYTVGWWETHLVTYDMHGGAPRLLEDRIIPEVKDPHSACAHDGRLLVASTGTDEIIALDLETGGTVGDIAETYWRASAAGEDTHHVNSVCSDGERVLISAFGPRLGEHWSSATRGYIYDVFAEKRIVSNLRQPHSVCIAGERIYFIESAKQIVRTADGKRYFVGGYARGCDVAADSTILVGSNAARRKSRSRGTVFNANNPEPFVGESIGGCRLQRITPGADPQIESYDLREFGQEIYDLRVLH